VLPDRVVIRLLALLSVAAGSLDVVCVLRLGGLFASVATGNLVQLGRAIATVDGRLAASTTTAVGGYALGVAAGAVALRGSDAGWRRRTSLVAVVELLLLTGVAVVWLATGGHVGGGTQSVLLGVAAAAMGVQSTVTIGSGVPEASTTYLTGTLTGLMRALAPDPRRFNAAAAARVAAFLCGAALGALVIQVAPTWAPALPVALVALVVAAALVRGRPEGAVKAVARPATRQPESGIAVDIRGQRPLAPMWARPRDATLRPFRDSVNTDPAGPPADPRYRPRRT
jgi:uncharacterized membrane protein YoaK (UPF0700 family)